MRLVSSICIAGRFKYKGEFLLFEIGDYSVSDLTNWKPCPQPEFVSSRKAILMWCDTIVAAHGEALWDSFWRHGGQCAAVSFRLAANAANWQDLADILDRYNSSQVNSLLCVFCEQDKREALGMAQSI